MLWSAPSSLHRRLFSCLSARAVASYQWFSVASSALTFERRSTALRCSRRTLPLSCRLHVPPSFEQRLQELARVRPALPRDLFGGAPSHDPAPTGTAFGTEIDNVIRRLDDVELFDHYNGVPPGRWCSRTDRLKRRRSHALHCSPRLQPRRLWPRAVRLVGIPSLSRCSASAVLSTDRRGRFL